MCIVSMAYDYYGKKPEIAQNFDYDSYQLLREILDKLKELDEKLGEKDCEDPRKGEWLKDMERKFERKPIPSWEWHPPTTTGGTS